jgi:hypothetical protein
MKRLPLQRSNIFPPGRIRTVLLDDNTYKHVPFCQGGVLGASQMGGQASRGENGRPAAVVQVRYGRRSLLKVGQVRRANNMVRSKMQQFLKLAGWETSRFENTSAVLYLGPACVIDFESRLVFNAAAGFTISPWASDAP